MTNMDLSKPPQIGGRAVSRSRGLENNYFLLPKPFSRPKMIENLKMAHFWNPPCVNFQKMVSEVKKNYSPGP